MAIESSRTLMIRFFAADWSVYVAGEHTLRSILTFLSHGRDVDEDSTMVAWKRHSSHPGSNSGGPEWEHRFSACKIPLTSQRSRTEINGHISTCIIVALMSLFCRLPSPAVVAMPAGRYLLYQARPDHAT